MNEFAFGIKCIDANIIYRSVIFNTNNEILKETLFENSTNDWSFSSYRFSIAKLFLMFTLLYHDYS